ncbi:MAG: FGGY family carbohydrate kinase, partial [Lentisphaeria bacterium]|nr:FGGY family carbohydrate kinase [Lentisphaeria bacterium]
MYNYLGFDLGTGAVKAVCWSPSRGLLARLSERLVFSSSTASCYEYDAEAHFSLVLGMMRRLAEQAEAPIAGLAFAAASGNTLICDQQGRPLTAVISWLDQRLPWQPPDDWQVRQVTGWPGIPSFPLMHLQWYKENNPALLQGSCIGM